MNTLSWILIMIRIWLGAIMIKHSTTYLFGGKMSEFISYVGSLGFPAPEISAYLSQWLELVCALLILIGVRSAAVLLAIHMAVAVIVAHGLRVLYDGELAFNYLLLSMILSTLGMGKYSIGKNRY